MKEGHINTVQNVALDYQLAETGTRIIARILDSIFITLYIVLAIFIFVIVLDNSEGVNFHSDIQVFIMFIAVSPIIFYSLWAPYFMQGQTFGKKIMKIKIVKEDGLEAGFGTYLVRWLLNIVDQLFYNIVGLIVMSSTARRQRVADLVAKTIVISLKHKIDISPEFEFYEDYQPKFSQVLQLNDKDIRIIRSAFTGARARRDYELVHTLRNKIESVIFEYKPEMTDFEYVETVLKDYQYFSEQQ